MISRFSKINKRKTQPRERGVSRAKRGEETRSLRPRSFFPVKFRIVPIQTFLLAIFALAVIGFLIVSNWRIGQQRTEQASRLESLRQEIRNLEKQNRELESLIAQIPTEFFLEQRARGLGLKRPGEEVVVISLPKEIKNEEGDDKRTFWQKFLNWLGF